MLDRLFPSHAVAAALEKHAEENFYAKDILSILDITFFVIIKCIVPIELSLLSVESLL